MRSTRRGGACFRVADPDWDDPLDGSFSMRYGRRWNGAGSFPVVYLNESIRGSRANAAAFAERLEGMPFSFDEIDESARPVLVHVDVPEAVFLDARTVRGLESVGLPASYPLAPDGSRIGWDRCQPIGQLVWATTDWQGISCRSAAAGLGPRDLEIAWFARDGRHLTAGLVQEFDEWFE